MPITGPAASTSPTNIDDWTDEPNDRADGPSADGQLDDGPSDGQPDGARLDESHDRGDSDAGSSRSGSSRSGSGHSDESRRRARSNRDDGSGSSSEVPSPTPIRTKPVSARPKRRSHTEGNTPLLTRAFDAAASRVRPSSTMESLIPRTPPLPEPPHPAGPTIAWPAVRFT